MNQFTMMNNSFYSTVGSKAYGLATSKSDTDIRGFYMPTFKQLVEGAPEQYQYKDDSLDLVLYDVRKFFAQAQKGSSLVIESLYAKEKTDLTGGSFIVDWFIVNKYRFVTSKLFHSYMGSALNEYNKFVKTEKGKHLASALRFLVSLENAYNTGDILCDVSSSEYYDLIKDVKSDKKIKHSVNEYKSLDEKLSLRKSKGDFGNLCRKPINQDEFLFVLNDFYKDQMKKGVYE